MEDTFLLTELEFEPGPPMCESYLHTVVFRIPEHPAHWMVRVACGWAIYVCEDRRLRAEAEGSWICTLGCGRRHYYRNMEWTPVPRAQ